MKKSELMTRVLAGERLLVVEYRSGTVDRINYRDKTTGKALEFVKITHNVEAGTRNIIVSERVSEGVDLGKWVQPIKKGGGAVLILESLQTERGVTQATGQLEALVD